MSEIDWKAVSFFRQRSRQNFAKANFAYTHTLKLLLDRLKIMHVSSEAVLLCGVNDTSSNLALRTFVAENSLTIIEDQNELSSLSGVSFDVILINFIFSVSDIETVFSELLARLKPGGVLLFSILGSQSFRELKQAFGPLYLNHVCSFYDMHDVGDALYRQHFDAPVMENIPLTVRYSSVANVFRDLRYCGAQSPLVQRPRHLMGKDFWARVQSRYPRMDQCYPVTLDVVIGHAWKKSKTGNLQGGDEFCVSVNDVVRKNKGNNEKN